MINISGLNKAQVLAALCNGTSPRGLGWLSAGSDATEAQAVATLAHSARVDYFAGRPIKIDFDGDEIDPRLYDRDAGEGACARVIAELREKSK